MKFIMVELKEPLLNHSNRKGNKIRMKIISRAYRVPGHAFCNCGTEFEFDYNDIVENKNVRRGAYIYCYNSITCPVCKKEIELPKDLDSICPWVLNN